MHKYLWQKLANIYTLIYIYCHFLKNLKIIKGCRWQLKALISKTHLQDLFYANPFLRSLQIF